MLIFGSLGLTFPCHGWTFDIFTLQGRPLKFYEHTSAAIIVEIHPHHDKRARCLASFSAPQGLQTSQRLLISTVP